MKIINLACWARVGAIQFYYLKIIINLSSNNLKKNPIFMLFMVKFSQKDKTKKEVNSG